MMIENRDWENWKDVMSIAGSQESELRSQILTRPRPGHADLAGALKYGHYDIRNILERSSARETTTRVAVGAVCKRFLDEFGIKVMSWVVGIGGVGCKMGTVSDLRAERSGLVESGLSPESIFERAELSNVRCPDKSAEKKMKAAIDKARKNGDSVGGIFEVAAIGVPPGLGSHVQWDRKLDARLAMCLMSIQAIKGVEVGMGFGVAVNPGSKVHDEIFYRSQKSEVRSQKNSFWPLSSRFYRETNNAGGIEGGMSNGEPIVLRAAMKPIPTLYKPLKSVDIKTKKPFNASVERSDICAVPAASIIGEAVVAFEITNAFIEKFGGDSLEEIKRNYQGYLDYLKRF
jgi:chorismate synthase